MGSKRGPKRAILGHNDFSLLFSSRPYSKLGVQTPDDVSAHETAIGNTTAAITPYSAIPSKGQYELRCTLPPPFPCGCDRLSLGGIALVAITEKHTRQWIMSILCSATLSHQVRVSSTWVLLRTRENDVILPATQSDEVLDSLAFCRMIYHQPAPKYHTKGCSH